MCYDYLLGEVKAIQARPKGMRARAFSGPVSAVQVVRNGIHGPSVSTSRSLLGKPNVYCAAYRTSLEIDIVRGAMLGAAVAGGDVGALLPALRTLAPLLGLSLP
jgi:hypothetical protein